MAIEFKYDIGQKVFYNDEMWSIIAQKIIRTKHATILSYNLKKVASLTEYAESIWEDEISTLQVIK